MAALRSQVSGQVNVELESSPGIDLASVIAEIREEYESIVKRNNKQLEDWYKKKVRADENLVLSSQN